MSWRGQTRRLKHGGLYRVVSGREAFGFDLASSALCRVRPQCVSHTCAVWAFCSFFSRHAFDGGEILSAACLRFPEICRGPTRLRPFRPTLFSAMGRRRSSSEEALARAAEGRILRLQNPGDCGAARILVQ